MASLYPKDQYMLTAHFAAIEDSLVAQAKIQDNVGHPNHKGTPREIFVKTFLSSHLAQTVAIGSGEIIDYQSKPGESRPQHDVVIYHRNYPKLDFGGDVHGFLIESVVATIEVKSTLDKAGMSQAIGAAMKTKALKSHNTLTIASGPTPPGPLSFVVAYDGPASVQTTYNWLTEIHASSGISSPSLNSPDRLKIPAPTIDGFFVLNKGFGYFDNVADAISEEGRAKFPDLKWVMCDAVSGSLAMLFYFLTSATSGQVARTSNVLHYSSGLQFPANRMAYGIL